MMGEAIIMFVCAIGVAVGAALLPTADAGRPRTIGKWCVGGLAVATAMQIIAWIGRTGHGADVLVFCGVIAALASFSVAVVWSIRNRQPTEEEPTPAGTFAASTVYMRRRRF